MSCPTLSLTSFLCFALLKSTKTFEMRGVFMENLKESILKSWIRMSLSIHDERIVSSLSYNESLIFHLLYERHQQLPTQPMTATELCHVMRMQKSQMNRTLTQMEQKELIVRERSTRDKRQMFVRINFDKIEIYQQQHEQILRIIDELITMVGKDKAEETVRLFELVADAAEKMIK